MRGGRAEAGAENLGRGRIRPFFSGKERAAAFRPFYTPHTFLDRGRPPSQDANAFECAAAETAAFSYPRLPFPCPLPISNLYTRISHIYLFSRVPLSPIHAEPDISHPKKIRQMMSERKVTSVFPPSSARCEPMFLAGGYTQQLQQRFRQGSYRLILLSPSGPNNHLSLLLAPRDEGEEGPFVAQPPIVHPHKEGGPSATQFPFPSSPRGDC